MENAKESLAKIEQMLEEISRAKSGLVQYFGAELMLAAETLKNFEQIENDMKQLRGRVMEYVV